MEFCDLTNTSEIYFTTDVDELSDEKFILIEILHTYQIDE